MQLRRGLAGLWLAVLFLGCAIRPMPGYEANPPLPQVAGELQLAGLQAPVTVARDQWGVPHIFAENAHDLFMADGFVQAQDRMWQIALFRAISTGTTAEIFGEVGVPGKEAMGIELTTVGLDKRMRIMGMRYIGEVGEVLLKKMQPELFANMQAYCDGLNAYLEQNRGNLPLEFQILYYEPEPFRVADVISLSRFYGSNLSANLEDELARFALAARYGDEVMWKLMPLHDSPGPTVVPREMLSNRLEAPRPLPPGGRPDPSLVSVDPDFALELARAARAYRMAAAAPLPWGSNNWVVGPKVTATGTAMLANDPHLLHIEPSLCYLIHLNGAGYDAYGCSFPGNPYVVMGHTSRLSWGATVTGADVQDLFIETVDDDHPGQYLYKGQWRDFAIREEVIRVRPGIFQARPDRRFNEKKIEIKMTVHGPVINEIAGRLEKDAPPLAFRWTGYDFSRDPKIFQSFIESADVSDFMARLDGLGVTGDRLINVGLMFEHWNKGRGIEDFKRGMEYNELLNMNWVAADADGHIAYLPGGLVPIRGKGIGALPAPGESGEYDWTGFIPLDEVPQAFDPERGWMATANNEVVDAEWYPYVFATNYAMGWRAWRIENLIKELAPITMDDMKRIQNDVHVQGAEVFVPLILKAVEEAGVEDKRVLEAAKILAEWDKEATIDQAGPAIFYDAMSHLADRVLKDDFDKKGYEELVKGAAGSAVVMMVIAGESEYFDDRGTRGKVEDVNDALAGALADAVAWLSKELGRDMQKWKWGDLHTVTWYHPMGFGPLKEMTIGPFPHPGGNDTVRNASSIGIGSKKYMGFGGPVLRHVIDMGDPHNAQIVIDGSESGMWLSPHYRDLHTLWYNSAYIAAEKRREKVMETAENVLVLKP